MKVYVIWFTESVYTFVTIQIVCVEYLRLCEMGYYIKRECYVVINHRQHSLHQSMTKYFDFVDYFKEMNDVIILTIFCIYYLISSLV